MNLSNVFNFIKENAYIIGPALLVLGIIAVVIMMKRGKIKDTQGENHKTDNAAPQPPAKTTIKEIGVYVLIVSVLATVTLPAFTTYVWLEGFQTNFHISLIFSALFFILAEVMMIKIYNEKAEMEQQNWKGLNDWSQALDMGALKMMYNDTVKKFQEVYKDSIWVKYTPPYALVSYIIITSIGLTVFIYHFDRLVEAMGWSYALSLAALLGFVVINLNVKFINDIYNLIKKYRQAKTLNKQLNLSGT